MPWLRPTTAARVVPRRLAPSGRLAPRLKETTVTETELLRFQYMRSLTKPPHDAHTEKLLRACRDNELDGVPERILSTSLAELPGELEYVCEGLEDRLEDFELVRLTALALLREQIEEAEAKRAALEQAQLAVMSPQGRA